MKNSKLFLIFALFMVLLCCFSAVSASEDVSDDTVAVSDDFAVDEVIGEVDSNDESLSIPDEEILASDDSNNESLEINDVEEVDDVDNSSTALAAEENDVEEVDDVDNSSTALAAEENDDGLSGQSPPILISPGRLKNDDFTSSDSVYLLNGTYTLETGFWIGSDNNYNPVNNILIKPIESGSAVIMIDDQVNQIAFQISDGKNITFENIKFTTADPNKSYTNFATVFSTAYGVEDVTFRNCTFENIINGHYGSSTSMGLSMIFEVSSASDPAPKNLNIESCKFINISANDAIIWVNCGISDLYISDCIFENNSVPYVLNLKEVNNVYLSDNSFNSTVPITISTGKIADVSFKVLTESLTKDESEFIVGELIDDNGNRIYSANLKIKINNVEQTTNFDPDTGCYKVSYTPSEIGTVNVSAVCNNANLNAGHTQIPVKKPISTLTLGDNITFDYGKSGSTTVSYEGATKVKAVVVENESAIVKVENNNITVSGLNAGNYTLKVTAIADEDHENVSKTVKITVNKVNATINLNNITLDYGSSNSTTFTGEGIKNITASIEGQADKVTVSENTITVSGLNAGSYTLKVIVNPDENHNMIETTVNITVNKIDTVVNIANEVVYDIGSTGQCIVSTEGAVNITAGIVNHTEANITINNSIISINGLKAGKYVMNVTTNPDNNHKSVTVSVNVTVNLVSVPAAQALTTNVPANTKSPTFSIKLDKEATGTFTVNIDNGKIVKTAELKDGAASITVADLAAGDHTISVSYSGDGKYAPITQNTTLNIKEPVKPTTKVTKKATKIVAKKKTFKAKKKTKKYTITLKSGKKLISKVKVTIKVGKKTYTAKTNKKGKATFNLKKLTKKGKYTAVIKFKGNKNYKATSKKVKITVKK